MSSQSLQKVDHAALRANQITIILLSITAFVLDLPWLVLLISGILAVGIVRKAPGFDFLYKFLFRPFGMKPDVLDDHPEPHRFSQILGGTFLFIGAGALYLGAPVAGWLLVWLVIALAALNAFGGFCVGCALYYWLGRMNLPSFTKQPPPGTYPGKRPL